MSNKKKYDSLSVEEKNNIFKMWHNRRYLDDIISENNVSLRTIYRIRAEFGNLNTINLDRSNRGIHAVQLETPPSVSRGIHAVQLETLPTMSRVVNQDHNKLPRVTHILENLRDKVVITRDILKIEQDKVYDIRLQQAKLTQETNDLETKKIKIEQDRVNELRLQQVRLTQETEDLETKKMKIDKEIHEKINYERKEVEETRLILQELYEKHREKLSLERDLYEKRRSEAEETKDNSIMEHTQMEENLQLKTIQIEGGVQKIPQETRESMRNRLHKIIDDGKTMILKQQQEYDEIITQIPKNVDRIPIRFENIDNNNVTTVKNHFDATITDDECISQIKSTTDQIRDMISYNRGTLLALYDIRDPPKKKYHC